MIGDGDRPITVEDILRCGGVVADKVAHVEPLVDAYVAVCGDRHDPETSVTDMLADLMLYVRLKGWSLDGMLIRAMVHVDAEWLGLP